LSIDKNFPDRLSLISIGFQQSNRAREFLYLTSLQGRSSRVTAGVVSGVILWLAPQMYGSERIKIQFFRDWLDA
jgi:hypothetical protein